MGRPSSSRTIVTSAVSRIGTASTSTGRRTVASDGAATFQLDASAIEPRVNPSTWLPESPRKAAAGFRRRTLNGRKPTQANASASESTSTSRSGWTVTASIAKYAQAMPATVAASPSMLSRKLIAFVIPISHTTAIGTAIQSFLTASTVSPFVSTIATAAPCAASFASGGREKASSSSPTANSSAAPPRIASSSELAPTASAARARPAPTSSPTNTPIPPTSGVARVCQRSGERCATSRRASGELRASQIVAAAVGNATAETSASIAAEVTRASVDWPGVSVYVDLLHYRELFANLFRRDLRAKYKGSFLGVLWSLVNPLVLMGIYTLVFSVLLKVGNIPHYPLYLLSGLSIWVFVSGALAASSRSLLDNANLIKKVRFPRQLAPFSTVATHLVSFAAILVLLIPINFAIIPATRDTVWLALPL